MARQPRTKARASAAGSTDEPLLDVHDIQGNILAGFNKDHQRLIALQIRDVAAARRWLARVVPSINSLAEVHQFNTLFRMRRSRLGRDPHGLVATWMNIAFSRDGIAKLTSDADALPDTSFVAGLTAERSEFLGDPVLPGQTDPTAKWVVGGTGRVPDILMIIASDDPQLLASAVQRLRPTSASGDGPNEPETIWEEQGDTRPDLPGHEHFGFKDGVSQPGVRGLMSKRPKAYLTPRLLKPPAAGAVEFAKPGQPLVWPGHFVLGYDFGDRTDGSRRPAVPLKQPWFKNGSFLVFRRLNQNVAGFHAFLKAEQSRLVQQPGFAGITSQRLGALLVGRWGSGAPVSRTPAADLPDLAKDNLSINDFLFTQDTPPPDFLQNAPAKPGDFPRAMEGSKGPVCPHAAHIFKVNPRDEATDVGPDFDTLTRRILRRGIPFGPPMANPDNVVDDGVERGLHFLCYQASIVDQFEFLQQDWANNTGPPAGGGQDLIIGQSNSGIRTLDLAPLIAGQPAATVTAPRQWITPSGGGYFFAPSISAIRDELAKIGARIV